MEKKNARIWVYGCHFFPNHHKGIWSEVVKLNYWPQRCPCFGKVLIPKRFTTFPIQHNQWECFIFKERNSLWFLPFCRYTMSATEQCQQFLAYAVCLPLSSAFEFFKLCLIQIVNNDTTIVYSKRTISKHTYLTYQHMFWGFLYFLCLCI